jgi:hypothetical protein
MVLLLLIITWFCHKGRLFTIDAKGRLLRTVFQKMGHVMTRMGGSEIRLSLVGQMELPIVSLEVQNDRAQRN